MMRATGRILTTAALIGLAVLCLAGCASRQGMERLVLEEYPTARIAQVPNASATFLVEIPGKDGQGELFFVVYPRGGETNQYQSFYLRPIWPAWCEAAQ